MNILYSYIRMYVEQMFLEYLRNALMKMVDLGLYGGFTVGS